MVFDGIVGIDLRHVFSIVIFNINIIFIELSHFDYFGVLVNLSLFEWFVSFDGLLVL